MPRSTKIPGLSVRSPFRRAAGSALVYVVICVTYILVSGRLAAKLAHSTQQLQAIETFKGIAFVIVTGVLFFTISLAWWRKAERQEELLRQSERRTVAGMYGAALAHDLNNLLMALCGLVDELRDREQGDAFLLEMREDLERGIEDLAHLSKRVAASAQELQPLVSEKVDLREVLSHIAELVRKHPDVKACSMAVADIPPVSLWLSTDAFEQAVMNLIINAAQAAGEGGQIEVVSKLDGNSVSLEVHDGGPGVPLDRVDQIFGPGFTTKADGTGLGLLAVQAFASSCNTEVSVDRSHLGGAVFRLRLPMSAEAAGMHPYPSSRHGADEK